MLPMIEWFGNKISSSLFQYVPVPEVSGGLGSGAAGRLCAGVPLRVPLAFLALHSQCLRLLQIPGPGECVCV